MKFNDNLIDKLSTDVSLPGLNFNSVADNYIKETIKDLDTIPERQRKPYLEQVEKNIQPKIEQNIQIIKNNYAVVNRNLSEINRMLTETFQVTTLTPSVLGQVTVNPIYTKEDTLQKLTLSKTSIDNLNLLMVNLLYACNEIKYKAPTQIVNLVNLLVTVKEIVKNF